MWRSQAGPTVGQALYHVCLSLWLEGRQGTVAHKPCSVCTGVIVQMGLLRLAAAFLLGWEPPREGVRGQGAGKHHHAPTKGLRLGVEGAGEGRWSQEEGGHLQLPTAALSSGGGQRWDTVLL